MEADEAISWSLFPAFVLSEFALFCICVHPKCVSMRTNEDGEAEQAILMSLWDSSSDVLYSFQRLAELNITQSQLLPYCWSILSLHESLLRDSTLAEQFGVRLSKVAWEKSDQVKVLEILRLMSPSCAVENSVLSFVLTLSLVLSGP